MPLSRCTGSTSGHEHKTTAPGPTLHCAISWFRPHHTCRPNACPVSLPLTNEMECPLADTQQTRLHLHALCASGHQQSRDVP